MAPEFWKLQNCNNTRPSSLKGKTARLDPTSAFYLTPHPPPPSSAAREQRIRTGLGGPAWFRSRDTPGRGVGPGSSGRVGWRGEAKGESDGGGEQKETPPGCPQGQQCPDGVGGADTGRVGVVTRLFACWGRTVSPPWRRVRVSLILCGRTDREGGNEAIDLGTNLIRRPSLFIWKSSDRLFLSLKVVLKLRG